MGNSFWKRPWTCRKTEYGINPLNAELNRICHLLALLGGANLVVVSRLRVNDYSIFMYIACIKGHLLFRPTNARYISCNVHFVQYADMFLCINIIFWESHLIYLIISIPLCFRSLNIYFPSKHNLCYIDYLYNRGSMSLTTCFGHW
jgi:hypothetical protein